MRLSTLSLVFASTTLAVNTTRPFSTWMASSFLSKGQPINNHYVSSVVHEGIQKAAVTQNDSELLAYASNAVSSLVSPNGTLKGWNSSFYSLDDIRIGNNLLYFWNAEGRTKHHYVVAAHALRQQLDRWPRTPTGGFWHRAPIYKNQMWLDGIYMADTFYASYTAYFEPDNTTAWDDIALQFDLLETHTRNHSSRLLKHGYSEDKTAVWADPVTGASPYVWNRAVGWYLIALVDVLEVFPTAHPAYPRLASYLASLADGVAHAQDKPSGGWHLLMDEGLAHQPRNYIESSATAMFAYAYLKARRLDLLEHRARYAWTARRAWSLLLAEFVRYEANGTLSFTGTVEVGSLSGNASFEYYVGVKRAVNDGKGVGPFMYLASEVERAGLAW